MDSERICEILNRLSKEYIGGVYPGRNSEGLNPEWPCDPFHVLIATILLWYLKFSSSKLQRYLFFS